MELRKPTNDFGPIHGLLMGAVTSRAVMAALELKVFDVLARGPATLEELADKLGTLAHKTEPLLDLLVSVGLAERNGKTYGNTLAAEEFLVSWSPLYQGLCLRLTMGFVGGVEGAIPELLAGGSGGGRHEGDWSGEEVMEGTAQDARGTALYPVVEAAAQLPGFDRFESMCDIGGNHGLFTMGVLSRNPAMTGTVLDLPPVAEQARERCHRAGFEGRMDCLGFDFGTDPLPEAAFDLVLTSHILYRFKDDLPGALAKIWSGLKPGGWFLSHHYAGRLNPDQAASANALELLTRLAGYPSHFIERDELKDGLAGAGFTEIDFQPLEHDRFGLLTRARRPV